jgi:esterase/lipase
MGGVKVKIIKCHKCGASVVSEDTMIESMMGYMKECTDKARKTKNNSYLQEASQIKNFITQILHRQTRIEDRTINKAFLSTLIVYIRTNNIIPDEKLNELENMAIEKAKANIEKDEKIIKQMYGDFESMLTNRTKKDPTSKKAIGD